MRKLRLALLAVLVALACSAPARATTAPGQRTVIHVRLTDRGIWIQFGGQEARGVIVHFEIVNRGKKRHDFSLLGRRTRILRPGGKATFAITLTRRGVFPYRSTVDRGKRFRGRFIVY